MQARFRITSVDYEPEDLAAQVPFDAILLRKVAGPDRPDYWLAALVEPLNWLDNGMSRNVTHIIVAARYEGETIEPGFERHIVGLAYVTDDTLLSDPALDFAKCRYVAIGEAVGVTNQDAASGRA